MAINDILKSHDDKDSGIVDLLPCPFCNGEAKTYCKIETFASFRKNALGENMSRVLVKCTRCGYYISILTRDRKIIRKLWNVRAI